MSAEDNLKTVAGIYEAFGAGNVDAILDVLADDVDWAADADTESDKTPWWGERKGKDEVAAFFGAIAGALNVTDFTPISITSNDTDVAAFIRFAFTPPDGGETATMNIHHYWRFNAEGKVERYRGSEDTAQTLRVLGA